jgi:K+/H+ antiporter YhaU regulatory subunit KhtT
MKLKVEGHPGLVRDSHSKAIIMQDSDSFKAYQAEKHFRENMSQVNSTTREEINNLREEMHEIKELLGLLFHKIDQKKV